MTCGIYAIINKITGKTYVGQSINIERRIDEHKKCKGLRNNSYIDSAIKKYGWKNFTCKILHKCTPDELDVEEQKFINIYSTFKQGYNLTPGGDFCPSKVPEIAKKISKSKNTTGYYRVHRDNVAGIYIYTVTKNKKVKSLSSVNIRELYFKVINENLPWKILDVSKARNTLKESDGYIKSNSLGFLRVFKLSDDSSKIGYSFVYRWFDENNNYQNIRDIRLPVLEWKVRELGLEWNIEYKDKADITLKGNMDDLYDLTSSGVYRVSKFANNQCNLGYSYSYQYVNKKGNQSISNYNLKELKSTVEQKGLPWIIINKTKYEECLLENEFDIKQSKELQDNTGFFNVTKYFSDFYNWGYYYCYVYYTDKNIRKTIENKSIEGLERKVKEKNLKWEIINSEKAQKTLSIDLQNMNAQNNTGFYRVSKVQNKLSKHNTQYRYSYFDKDGERKEIHNSNILKLELLIKEKGFKWEIIDENKAEQTLLENEKNTLNDNVTGYFRTGKVYSKRYAQGFAYVYQYYDDSNKRKHLTSTNLFELEKKVKSEKLPWGIINQQRALETLEENNNNKSMNSKRIGSTGFYRVSKKNHTFQYSYRDNGKQKSICNQSILKLKELVLEKNLTWKIIDKDKANQTLDNNRFYLENKSDSPKSNTTGFYRVHKHKSSDCKQGYTFEYCVFKNGTFKKISSIDIFTLEKKVRSKGLKWKVTNEILANETIRQNKSDISKSKLKPHGNCGKSNSHYKKTNSTGFYRVSKVKNENMKIGYFFSYSFLDNGRKKRIINKSILKLEKIVKSRGLDWRILDEFKAEQTLVENKKDIFHEKKYRSNSSGIANVSIHKTKKGFTFNYRYTVNKKRKSISAHSINLLKEKVVGRGLEWFVLDITKAKEYGLV